MSVAGAQPEVVFLDMAGQATTCAAAPGSSVMQVAMQNGVGSIRAECGGACSCATCHVYVVEGMQVLPEQSEVEQEMLDFTAAERRDNSRLGCQLLVPAEPARIVIQVPDEQ